MTEAKQLLATSPIWSEDEVDERCNSILNLIKNPVDLSNTDAADHFNLPARFVSALNLLYADWRSLLSEAAAQHVGHAESGTVEIASARSQRNGMKHGDSLDANGASTKLSPEHIERCLEISQNIFNRIRVNNGNSADRNAYEKSKTGNHSAPSSTPQDHSIAFQRQSIKSETSRQDREQQQDDEQARVAKETTLLKRIFDLRLFLEREKSTSRPSDQARYVNCLENDLVMINDRVLPLTRLKTPTQRTYLTSRVLFARNLSAHYSFKSSRMLKCTHACRHKSFKKWGIPSEHTVT